MLCPGTCRTELGPEPQVPWPLGQWLLLLEAALGWGVDTSYVLQCCPVRKCSSSHSVVTFKVAESRGEIVPQISTKINGL